MELLELHGRDSSRLFLPAPAQDWKDFIWNTAVSIDATIRALSNALVNNHKLKVLNLNDNLITNTGWEMFSSVLESPNTALEELHLGRNEMNDATCTALLNSLAGNTKLKKLMLDNRSAY